MANKTQEKEDKDQIQENKDKKIKAIIYGGNYLAGVFGNLLDISAKGPIANTTGSVLENQLKMKSSLANPVGGIFFGALDLARYTFPQIKDSLPVKVIEGAGAAYYSASVVADLLGWLNGDWSSLVQLPFDASMAYSLSRNIKEDFKKKSK